MNQKPTTSRAVHYVLKNGEHRTGEIINVPNPNREEPYRASLRVTLDAANDIPKESRVGSGAFSAIITDNFPAEVLAFVVPVAEVQISSVQQDEVTKRPGSWHWPERE